MNTSCIRFLTALAVAVSALTTVSLAQSVSGGENSLGNSTHVVAAVPPSVNEAGAPAIVSLVPDRDCYEQGDVIAVNIDMTAAIQLIAGGQFFVQYDTTRLEIAGGRVCVNTTDPPMTPCTTVLDCGPPSGGNFPACRATCAGGANDGQSCTSDADCPSGFCTDGAEPGAVPFDNELFQAFDEVAGTIDYAVGADFGDPGTSADSMLARLVFRVIDLGSTCLEGGLVSFRLNDPPTKLTNIDADTILPALNDLSPISIDSEVPTTTGSGSAAPLDGACESLVTYTATVSDNCCMTCDSVDVSAIVPAGNATLSPISCACVPLSDGTVEVTCTATVSSLTECSTAVEWTFTPTDCCGNTGVPFVDTVSVDDGIAPVSNLTAPAVVTVDPGSCTADIIATGSVTDNCSLNAADVSATVSSGLGVTNGPADCTFTQNGPNTVDVFCSIPVSNVIDCADSAVSLTLNAADLCGNNALTKTIQVQVLDETPPAITCNAQDVFLNSECRAAIDFTANSLDNCCLQNGEFKVATNLIAGCGTIGLAFTTTKISPTETSAEGRVQVIDVDCCQSTAQIMFNSLDCCQNPGDTCILTANVINAIPPTIVCPADVTLSCAEDIPAQAQTLADFELQGGSAAGGCGAPFEFSPLSDDSLGTCPQTITRTYQADSCGVISTCTQIITVDDNDPPVPTCTDVVVQATANQCETAVTLPEIATDNCAGPLAFQYEADLGNGFMPVANPFVYPAGVTPVRCTVTDACDNSGVCTLNVTVVDELPPTIDCPMDVAADNDAGACGANVTYPMPTASDNCGVASVTCDRASGSFFDVGTTLVTCTATDMAGNTSQCSFNVTVNDTENPVVTCSADVVQDSDAGDCGAVVNYTPPTAMDNCDVASVTCDRASGSFFDVGTTLVTCTATDTSGNTSQCSFNVTVNDTEAPVVTCSANVVQDSDPGACGAVVDYTMPTASDNCSVASVSCDRASGSVFDVGTTTVTCTATDTAGNTSQCSFDVTVNDAEAPIIACSQDVKAATDPGQCTAVVDFAAPTASDNCGLASVTCDPPSGSTFDEGDTIVTCTATDKSGNTSQCSFTVTVNDGEDPGIACPADIATQNDTGVCGAVVNYTTPIATDNCQSMIKGTPVPVVCDPPSGTLFGEGATDVCCTATDNSGNMAQCCFTVTVDDTVPPVAKCPDDITVDSDPGICGAIVDFNPGANDNCPDASVVCDTTSGSEFSVGTTAVNCTAQDASGNSDTCTFNVTVGPTTNLSLMVQAEGLINDVDRCVTVTLLDCGNLITCSVDADCPGDALNRCHIEEGSPDGICVYELSSTAMYTYIAGDPGAIGLINEIVPCGSWDCVSAKDPQHTLRGNQPLADVGGVFTASFVGADRLISGDLDNDNLIDVEDFGAWTDFFFVPVDPNSTCASISAISIPLNPIDFHPDLDGDGVVTDFDLVNFIIRPDLFLTSGDGIADCCPNVPVNGGPLPVSRISVDSFTQKVGIKKAQAADANGDGYIDVVDVVLVAERHGLEVSTKVRELAAQQRIANTRNSTGGSFRANP
jgi:HYR domain